MAPLPENYQRLTAPEKQEHLWRRIAESAYHDDALPSQSFAEFLWLCLTKGLLLASYEHIAFERAEDFMPEGRLRLIHTHGTCAQIELEIDPDADHPYSGLFKTGALGLLRISLTLPARSFSPGISLKLLVDGQRSLAVALDVDPEAVPVGAVLETELCMAGALHFEERWVSVEDR